MNGRRRAAVACAAVVSALLLAGLPGPSPAHAATSVTCPASPQPVTAEQSARVWQIAADHLAALAGPTTYPFGATGASRFARTHAYAWTSGFFPTSLWLMYDHTKDPAWLTRARAYTSGVLPVARWRGTHDLGFMVGLPAAQGLRLDPSSRRSDAYASALRAASRSLSTRWNARVGAIRSAYYDGRWGLIIDSAMNAPMLIEAGLVYGDERGMRMSERGVRHMLTLASAFVREDGSTRHRVGFNPHTGAVVGPIYGQGLSTTSTWSRGQAWAINGFARSFRLTGDQRLLAAARRTADFWISRVPAGCIPAWDLDVTKESAPRDSSAAAIAVDGLLTLALVEDDPVRAASYRTYALTTLGTLGSAPWTTDTGQGVLQRQAYNIPADAREGTYAWGDTFLLHALAQASPAASG